MTLLYFAWVRQKIGKNEETIDLPSSVSTVGDLIAHLKTLGGGYAEAFGDIARVRAAVDQEHAPLEANIRDAKEVAFFPPVTGG